MQYSAVIPVHNEEASLPALCEKLQRVLERLGGPYEILFVDDASTDGSRAVLKKLAQSPHVVLFSFERRAGQSAALQAGFGAARGQILITLDGDLQNDPEDIPKLLKKMNEGYDVVCGWRRERRDAFPKKAASRLANAVRRALLKETVHDVGCSLRVFKREVLTKVSLSGERHRFFTALAARGGFRIGEAEVRHHPRRSGHSKYGIWRRLVRGTTDLFRITFSKENP